MGTETTSSSSSSSSSSTLTDLHQTIIQHKNRIDELTSKIEILRNTLDSKKLQSKQLKVKLATGGDLSTLQSQLDDTLSLITDSQVKENSLKQKISSENTLIIDYKQKYNELQNERHVLES